MMALFTDTALLAAAAASFLAGLLGYVIIRMWVRPIIHYHLIKRRLDGHLTRYSTQLRDDGAVAGLATRPRQDEATLRSARRSARDLATCYREQLPYWYRLLLESRNTAPTEIEGLLTNLHRINDRRQVQARIVQVRRMAGLD